MLSSRTGIRRRVVRAMAIATGSVFVVGMLESCNDFMVGASAYVDPCGTIFGNCAPGDIQVRAADIGDSCIDPACTVPGGCGFEGAPLGTITNVCP